MLRVTSPRGFLNFSATPSSIHRPCARHVLSPHHRYALGRRDGWSERWWPHARQVLEALPRGRSGRYIGPPTLGRCMQVGRTPTLRETATTRVASKRGSSPHFSQ
ncbi:hypothetical protein B296_00058376 [Ensete ventricosum]|uniref:Uncharacterized protein n=1 Tax=Ensete ventricosum TaxID=4639 RepID=A0A426XDU5_ENSVE|nr:hypothetical protein B296_00058376 [Ensete ventricosum]